MTTPEIHPHEVQAIRALVNLHDPDTQPDDWHPDHHATAETAETAETADPPGSSRSLAKGS